MACNGISCPEDISARRVENPRVADHVCASLVYYLNFDRVPTLREDPFSLAERMHEDFPPLFYTPHTGTGLHNQGVWVVTHYADIREVYQNDELYSTQDAAGFHKLVGETFPLIPLQMEGSEHNKYRAFLNPWFSPKSISRLEPKIRGTVSELIDGFSDRGECDVAYDFSRIYPVQVFLDLMGFPRYRLEQFLQWEYPLLHSYGDIQKIKWGISSAIAYIRSFIETVRSQPRDELASYIVHGRIDDQPLTEDEIIGTLTFLWMGGLDTVAATSALMFRRLALRPDLQQALRARPALIPEAVEEFLRVQPIVNSIRLVKKDHEIRGVKIKAGDHIMAYNLIGNFDPTEFKDPRAMHFDRQTNRHFTLAAGRHHCLGAHLARRELRIALEEFLKRIPLFEYKHGADKGAFAGLKAIANVPLVWKPEPVTHG